MNNRIIRPLLPDASNPRASFGKSNNKAKGNSSASSKSSILSLNNTATLLDNTSLDLSTEYIKKAPIALADKTIAQRNSTLTISIAALLANDSDDDSDFISLVSVSDSSNGRAVLNRNGTISFTPTANYTEPASFNYTIQDSTGSTSTATVNITVNSVNVAPVAGDDKAATARNGSVTIPISTLFANDYDPNGDTFHLTSLRDATNGRVVLDGIGNVIFTPNTNFVGVASFKYTIEDPQRLSDTATVSVTVDSLNRAPVAVNDTAETVVNKSLSIPIHRLLRNDSDPDGDVFNLVSLSDITNGYADLDAWGNVIFTPVNNFSGNASFKYTLKDVYGNTSVGNVTVNVREVTSLTAHNDALEVLANMPTNIFASTLLSNDHDPNNTPFSLSSVSNPVNGQVSINSYGNVVFTPNRNFVGTAGFSYTIRNADGAESTAQATVKVARLVRMPIGTNLSTIADWSPQLPFIDHFKTSRSWIWEGPYTYIEGQTDTNGWLTSVTPPETVRTPGDAHPPRAATVMLTDQFNTYPSGRYIVLYEGEGTITYQWSATKDTALSRPGRDVINLDATKGGMIMQILSTDPQGTGEYIRNIRMIPANFESTYTNFYSTQSFNPSSARIFNPLFMTRTQAFNTVRFMDWGRTNGSSQVNWSDRSTLQQAQWTNANGVPVEVMVALANQGRFNPWFTMPHMATDDYVRNYAQYVKNNLSRNQKIYIEYTNEAWNTIFPQTAWANAQGSQASMPGNHWFAQRTVEIIDIWKSVFGSESNRVIGVLGTQASNIWLGMDTINYLKDTGSLSKIDAVAIAPYFAHYLGDPMYQQQMRNLTLDQVFDELTQGGVLKNPDGSAAAPKGALEQSYIYMEHYTHLARSNNLQLLAYEGGQHMVGYWGVENDQQINDLFIGANKDPRMGQLYQQYLTRWNQIGGGLFVNYTDVATPSKWGSWGAMEHLGNNNNPKYAALMQMVLK